MKRETEKNRIFLLGESRAEIPSPDESDDAHALETLFALTV